MWPPRLLTMEDGLAAIQWLAGETMSGREDTPLLRALRDWRSVQSAPKRLRYSTRAGTAKLKAKVRWRMAEKLLYLKKARAIAADYTDHWVARTMRPYCQPESVTGRCAQSDVLDFAGGCRACYARHSHAWRDYCGVDHSIDDMHAYTTFSLFVQDEMIWKVHDLQHAASRYYGHRLLQLKGYAPFADGAPAYDDPRPATRTYQSQSRGPLPHLPREVIELIALFEIALLTDSRLFPFSDTRGYGLLTSDYDPHRDPTRRPHLRYICFPRAEV